MLVFLCRRFIDSVTDSRPGQLAVTSAHVADGVLLKVSLQSCKPYSCYIVSIYTHRRHIAVHIAISHQYPHQSAMFSYCEGQDLLY